MDDTYDIKDEIRKSLYKTKTKEIFIRSGNISNVFINGNPVINNRKNRYNSQNIGINLICFDSEMTKHVIWNFNHTNVNMVNDFMNILRILPKDRYCIITIKGKINRYITYYIKNFFITVLNCKKLNKLHEYSSWSLLFYKSSSTNKFVNIKEGYNVNHQCDTSIYIHPNPIISEKDDHNTYNNYNTYNTHENVDNKIQEDILIENIQSNIDKMKKMVKSYKSI